MPFMQPLPFVKMHGLGNDFVVIDGRRAELRLAPDQARAIADRRCGVGCDQLIALLPPRRADGDAFMQIFNADGGEAESCGNAARCVARSLMNEAGRDHVVIETEGGELRAAAAGDDVLVDMGPVRLEWRDIPLASEIDTLHLPIIAGPLSDAVAVSVGNPHVTFFVADAEGVDLAVHGPEVENDPMFPQRVNVGVATIAGPNEIRLRVWERGVGITRACGTAACAATVAASRRGHIDRRARVRLDGGALALAWREDGHVVMTGPTAISFTGTLAPELLAGPAR